MSADKFLGLDDNVCTTEERLIAGKEILLLLVSSVDDSKSDNDVV